MGNDVNANGQLDVTYELNLDNKVVIYSVRPL